MPILAWHKDVRIDGSALAVYTRQFADAKMISKYRHAPESAIHVKLTQ